MDSNSWSRAGDKYGGVATILSMITSIIDGILETKIDVIGALCISSYNVKREYRSAPI